MDVLGLRAFLSVCDSELDLLSVCQCFEAITLYSAEVNEYIWTIFLCDKTVALGLVKPLHGARYC